MANKYTALFINNQQVDLFKTTDLPLNITKQVNNIEGDVQGDFSRASITIPASKNNVLILVESRKFFTFRIKVDGQPSFNGAAQVRKGKKRSQGYAAIKETYEINLISNNSSWFVLLGDTFLSDLTTLIITYDFATVLGGFVSDPTIRDYGFAFIKLKEWANLVGTPPNIRFRLSAFETTPLLFIKPLLIAAFKSIGYKLESDWLDTDYASKLTMSVFLPEKMPFGYNEKYLNTEVSLSAPLVLPSSTVALFLFDTIDKAAPANPTAYNVATGEYTCPFDGYYELTLELTFPVTPAPVSPFEFGAGFTVDTVSLAPDVRINFKQPGGEPYPAGQTLILSTVVFVLAGSVISSVYAYISTSSLTISAAKMKIIGEAVPSEGIELDFTFLLEGLRFNDFLLGLKDMHNLNFETDDNAKVVRMEPSDSYLNTSKVPNLTEFKEGFYTGNQKDYSSLVDYNKKGEFRFIPTAGRFDFTYNSDSDPTADWIEGINDRKIYECRFPMSDGADLSKFEKKPVRFFSKTIHILDALARYPDTSAIPQFPLVYKVNNVLDPTSTEARTNIKPRILYFAGQRSFPSEDGLIELQELQGVQIANPLAFMVNYNDQTGLDPNMGFDNQTINGVLSIGLMQRYYLQNLARRDKGELRKDFVRFNSIDYLNFTFRTKAYIDAVRYIVQKLEGFDPTKDAPTNFTFFEDVFPDSDDVDNIQNSDVTGVVTNLTT